MKIGSHDKDETYVFDIGLYETYLNYVDNGEFNKVDIEIEEETKTILDEYFENIEERYERELLLKIRPQIEICKIKSQEQKEYAIELNSKYYDYVRYSLGETNRHKEAVNCHIEAMKDKEITLMDKEIILKDKEIILKDKDIILKDKDNTLKDKELQIKKIELEIILANK